MPTLDNTAVEIMCAGLKYPEGPVHCKDGSIILVEIMGQTLTQVPADGGKNKTLASLPGGPNGAAVGPDNCIYVCNSGGFDWTPIPLPNKQQLLVGGNQPSTYSGGSLQKVDVSTGSVNVLYTECADRYAPLNSLVQHPNAYWNPPFMLRGPDDLVVDEAGGIWFTDWGKIRARDKDITAVYYASADGKSIKQMIYPLNSPNGIGLSPCGKKLYVALTFERKVLRYDIPEPGVIDANPRTLDGSYLLTGDFTGQSILDSMALDVDGNVYVATMLPEGYAPASSGGITVISPAGDVEYIPIELPNADFAPLPSNICFGGKDMKTAYITCGAAGLLLKMPASIPGLELNCNGSHFDPKGGKQ